MKPIKPFKFIDRTKKLSRNNKIAAGLFIFFGLLFLYNEWEWRDRQDREGREQTREMCRKIRNIDPYAPIDPTFKDICKDYP